MGSNMGNKEDYLLQAVQALKETSSCQVEAVSDFLVTKPYGVTDQDDFLNGCLRLRTLLTPRELVDSLHTSNRGWTGTHLTPGAPGRWIWTSSFMTI